ncbi:MAG: hypothetical protein Kow0092_29030 [Deferrisomatales bacterium]
MSKRGWGAFLAVLAVLGWGLSGCGDGNVFEDFSDPSGRQAQIEEALEALDDGQWEEAIATLEVMDPDDPEVQKYLASAYMGRAGFDTLELVDLIAVAQEGNGDDSVLYDSVTGIFDLDGDGRVTAGEIADPDRAADIQAALAALDDASASEDVVFQEGVYAAVQAVVTIAEVIALDDASVASVRGNQATAQANVDANYGAGQIATLAADLAKMAKAVDAVMGNDVSDDFNEFLAEIDPDGDGAVSAQELKDFLSGL